MTDSFDSSRRGSRWEILHIPDEIRPPPDKQPTVNVITSTIEPGVANSLIRQLNRISPLENLPHVKRIQKKGFEGGECQLSIILCLAPESGDIGAIPDGLQKCCNLERRVGSTMQVVAYLVPSSKIQYRWDYWVRHRRIRHGLPFREVCNRFGNIWDCLVVNAAVIVDPSSNEVIASACDQVYSKHTSTVNGNAKTCNNCIAGKCQRSPDWCEDGMPTCLPHNCSSPDLKNRRDRELLPNFEGGGNGSPDVDSSPRMGSSQIKRLKADPDSVDNRKCDDGQPQSNSFNKPYLCTGYDVYLVWEPCTMCAMALVHHRLRCIFFAFPNSRAGAFGNFRKLHGQKSLNHHYAVFRGLIPGDLY